MRVLIFLFLSFVMVGIINAQSVGIGTEVPNTNAILDITSSEKGLLIPRMNFNNRTALGGTIIASGLDTDGMMVFDISDHKFYVWNQLTMTWKEVGGGGAGWNLNGNAGTDANVDFIGTTDAQGLSLRVNSIEKIRLLENGTLAFRNTGNSIFIGDNAGVLDDQTNNNNVFIGTSAGTNLITGTKNVTIGNRSLFHAETANYNVAVGFESAYRTTSGTLNVALGNLTLHDNTTGAGNVAVGANALYENTMGQLNTAIGFNVGKFSSQSDSCVFIGAFAGVNIVGTSYTNSIAIGTKSTVSADDQVRIGRPSTASIGGYQNWTNVSDQRFKKNIKEDVPGLEFILKLNPVSYNLDIKKLSSFLGRTVENSGNNKQVQSGFLAQEVEQTAKEIGYNFSGIDAPKNEDDHYGLRYATFVVPLVKSVQELSEENKQLKNELNTLKAAVEEIKTMLSTNN